MSLSREEIIRMAHAAGLFNDDQSPLPEFLEHFANAAYAAGAAAEREACAKLCEDEYIDVDSTKEESDIAYNCALTTAANAIRARGNGGEK